MLLTKLAAWLQPAGGVTAVSLALMVANSSRASSACTAAGTVTVEVVELFTARVTARKPIADDATETVTGWVVDPVAPAESVTVRVTSWVPGPANVCSVVAPEAVPPPANVHS